MKRERAEAEARVVEMRRGGVIYVSPYLGAGADFLAVLDASLTPLCSWMGGKRKLAPRILDRLGVEPGRMLLGRRVGSPPPCLLGDASWWGWVWPVVLDPVTGPRVSEVLRGWRGEDPRALWFRLRDLGPLQDPAEAAAQLLWLQARAASGVPVWWEDSAGGGLVQERGWKSPTCSTVKLFPATQGSADEVAEGRRERRARMVQWAPARPGSGADDVRGANPKGVIGGPGRVPRLLQEASTQVDDAGQRQAQDPRLLAFDGRNVPRETGHKGRDSAGGGGIVDPGTIAARADAIRARAMGADITIEHCDARELTERYAAEVGSRGRVYLDPPYQGATGYPAQSSRADVLWIAEDWARHGARVVLSEAVGLAGELGAGWTQEQLPSRKRPEWVTVYEGRKAA